MKTRRPKISILAGIASTVIEFVLASPAYALEIHNAEDINSKILCPIFKWIFFFLIFLSSVMILVAAYFYTTSGGDSEKVSRATKTFAFAAIGIVVAFAAKAFPGLIYTFFGGAAGTSLDNVCP